jgi:uncharacterized protein
MPMSTQSLVLGEQPRRRATQEITAFTDSREILANARHDIERLGLGDYFIVDVDSHHDESVSWPEVLEHIADPVLRDTALQSLTNWGYFDGFALTASVPGLRLQDVGGRVPHGAVLREPVPDGEKHRDVELVRRAMESMGIDIQIVFPQTMLEIGLHPVPEIATELMFAYNRWYVKAILEKDPAIKTMLGLPFENPDACLDMIKEFGDHPDVIGFLVTSQRRVSVHANRYMKVYAELERRGLPIGFHAGPTWGDTMTSTMNRFLSVHAASFVTCNMTHMTNWIVNGIPERFPNLKTIWIESGLAWLPFLMQRLDHEYLMRQSDAPLLTRMPSDYMREMFYTSQPMEWTDDALLESTFRAIDAESTLMYASDWPHWDFDLPGRIATIPFLSEKGKRRILGETAKSVFGL